MPDDKSIATFSPLGFLDTHNIILRLKREHTLEGIYGIQKQYKALAIYIDKKDDFVEVIQNKIEG